MRVRTRAVAASLVGRDFDAPPIRPTFPFQFRPVLSCLVSPSPLTVLTALTVGIRMVRSVSGMSSVSGGVTAIALLLDLAGRDHLREKEANVAVLHPGCCRDLLGAKRTCSTFKHADNGPAFVGPMDLAGLAQDA